MKANTSEGVLGLGKADEEEIPTTLPSPLTGWIVQWWVGRGATRGTPR